MQMHPMKNKKKRKNRNEREKPVAAEMGALFLAEMFLLFVIIYFCFTLMCVCVCQMTKYPIQLYIVKSWQW